MSGTSNGGLLVGASITQRPDLSAAAVCSAALLDMVRYERFGLGETWNDEFGTVADPSGVRLAHLVLALPPCPARGALPGRAVHDLRRRHQSRHPARQEDVRGRAVRHRLAAGRAAGAAAERGPGRPRRALAQPDHRAVGGDAGRSPRRRRDSPGLSTRRRLPWNR